MDERGAVSAIDFEHARVSPWFEVLHRLWWNEWAAREDLADAFFEGYGRPPTERELTILLATSLLGHLCTIVWAYEHADEAFGAHGPAMHRTSHDDE